MGGLKGQMMLITAVLVSLVMISTASAVASVGDKEYTYIQEGYLAEIIEQESSQVDKTFRKNRENYEKMLGYHDQYNPSTSYNDVERCYNITLENSESVIRLQCVG